MSVNIIARVLFLVGAILAIIGPAIAALRTALKSRKAKSYRGTYGDVDKMLDPANVQAEARSEAWWGVAEFSLVGLGVAFTAVASIILVPAD